jgi:DNA-directed RNA polymerase subunit RPC12/RpoP
VPKMHSTAAMLSTLLNCPRCSRAFAQTRASLEPGRAVGCPLCGCRFQYRRQGFSRRAYSIAAVDRLIERRPEHEG